MTHFAIMMCVMLSQYDFLLPYRAASLTVMLKLTVTVTLNL